MDQQDNRGIGGIIHAFRLKRGMTQSNLAFVAGVSSGIISELESGNKDNPGILTLMKIAGAMSTPASAMLRKLEQQTSTK